MHANQTCHTFLSSSFCCWLNSDLSVIISCKDNTFLDESARISTHLCPVPVLGWSTNSLKIFCNLLKSYPLAEPHTTPFPWTPCSPHPSKPMWMVRMKTNWPCAWVWKSWSWSISICPMWHAAWSRIESHSQQPSCPHVLLRSKQENSLALLFLDRFSWESDKKYWLLDRLDLPKWSWGWAIRCKHMIHVIEKQNGPLFFYKNILGSAVCS